MLHNVTININGYFFEYIDTLNAWCGQATQNFWPLSRTSMGAGKKFEIVNVWDNEKKSNILVSYRFENWVKVVSSSRALEENRTLYWFVF